MYKMNQNSRFPARHQLPHLDDQVINRYIKEIAQVAGLAENLKVVKKLTDKYYYFK